MYFMEFYVLIGKSAHCEYSSSCMGIISMNIGRFYFLEYIYIYIYIYVCELEGSISVDCADEP